MTCQRWEKQLDLPIHRLDGTPKARVFAYPDELDRWLKEKLHVAEAAGEPLVRTARTGRKRHLVAVAAASLLVLAGAAAWRFLLWAPLPAPAQVPSLAVLPFENRTGDPAWDVWKMALPDLIVIDLRQSKFLDVTKTSALFQAAGASAEAEKFSPEDLKKIAEKAKVDYAVTGSLVKSGGDVVIVALVQNARTGEVVGSPRSTYRTGKEIFTGVDELSRGVKIALNVKPREIRGDIDRPAARITTKSPQAFVFYSQAYRIQGKLKFEDSIAALQRAVALDPKFGLAYRLLSYSCMAVSRPDDAKKFGEIALSLADRLEERERCAFLDFYFSSEQVGRFDSRKCIQAYEDLRKNYPYDLMLTGLTSLYMGKEDYDKAVPILEQLILRHRNRQSVFRSLAACYRYLGFYEKSDKILGDYLKDHPLPAVPKTGIEMMDILGERWKLAVSRQQFDLAHQIIDQLVSAYPNLPSNLSRKGYTYFLQDDLVNAEKIYQRFADSLDPRSRMSGFLYLAVVSLSRGKVEEAKQRILKGIETAAGAKLEEEGPDVLAERNLHYFLAYLHRLSGRLPEALNEAELACRSNGKKGLFSLRSLHLKALIMADMNRFDEFERLAEEIKGFTEADRYPLALSGYPKLRRAYYHLLGHRELLKKNYPRAISYFWKALDLLSVLAAGSYDSDHAKYFYALAEAHERSGDSGSAFPMYEKIILPTVSREFSGDQYARSYYRMGLHYERMMTNMGTPADVQERRLKAVGYYRKFLELWKDADPIFPEVEDARQRLARLEAK